MVKKDSEKIKNLKAGARRHSIKEGIFSSAKMSFGDRYLSPFAIAINASNSVVALLGSLGGLLGPLSQMFGSRLIEKQSRKKIILKAVFWESMMWIPLIVIAILFYMGIITDILPLIFLLSFSLYIILANISGPAWFSWIGDIVDENYRGRWFAKRNVILGFVAITLALLSSFFLDFMNNRGLQMEGFIALFFLAMVSRLISWKILHKQYEPKIKLEKGYYFSFWSFLRDAPKTNFGKFAIYRSFLAFSTSIAAPLLAVYLLRNLAFTYTTYMIITLAGGVFAILVVELWGKFADRYGNYRTIVISSFLIPTIPILWILNTSPLYLVLVPSIIGGVAWAGFGLAAGNFIYDNVGQQKRGLAVSYYNMLFGFGTFLGAGLSAILIAFIKTTFIQPLVLIFIISGVVRMLMVIIWVPKFKEIRKTKKYNGTSSLKNLVFQEWKSTLAEEAHEIMSINKYLQDGQKKRKDI